MVGYGRTPPYRRLAGRRARRRPVRHQLRGRRREQYPARRRRLGGVPVGDRRRGAVAGHAPHEHGIDLRIRFARRLLAPAPDVHRTLDPGHGLRGRDRDGAQSRSGRSDERGQVGDRHPRLEMDRLSRHAGRSGGPAHRRGDPHSHRGRRRAAARLLSGAVVGQHDPARRARRAASSIAPTSTPTICPTGSKGRGGRNFSPPTRSIRTTCASPRRRASTPATSSTRI